jgi:diguanylate cyclase (GGDEF)-like protein/PAS domain S-box-containing protein
VPDTPPFDPVTLFKQILDNTNDVVVITAAHDLDCGGPTILFVNPAFTEVTGYTEAEAIGMTPRMLRGPNTDPNTSAKIRAALEAGQPIRTEVQNYAKDGHSYWADLNIVPLRNDDGQITHFAAIQRDVSAWKNLEQELTRLATTDALTGLRNRRSFFDVGAAEVARARRYGEPLSVITIDFDRFKLINDKYGHAAGDTTLVRFAEFCRRHVREADLLARLGGEEFAILLPTTPPDQAAQLAERIRHAVREVTILADGHSFTFTVSMGVAAYRSHDAGLEALLRRADEALYRAKETGRDRICVAEDMDPAEPLEAAAASGG